MLDKRRQDLERVRSDNELVIFGSPTCSATLRAYFSSLKSCSSNPIENVLTGAELSCAIRATTVDESTPPDRNAPNGTSEIILRRVDSRMMRVVSSIASCSLILIFGVNFGSQYRCVSIRPSFQRIQCPGSSLRIDLNAVCGAGTQRYDM